jgi:hypothetical protein
VSQHMITVFSLTTVEQAELTSPWRYISIEKYNIFSDVSKQNMGSLSIRHRSAGRLSPLRRSCSRPGSSRSLHANSCRPEHEFKGQLCKNPQARACCYRLCCAQAKVTTFVLTADCLLSEGI